MEGKEKVITVKTFLKDGKCYISFTDTGPGIPEEIYLKFLIHFLQQNQLDTEKV